MNGFLDPSIRDLLLLAILFGISALVGDMIARNKR